MRRVTLNCGIGALIFLLGVLIFRISLRGQPFEVRPTEFERKELPLVGKEMSEAPVPSPSAASGTEINRVDHTGLVRQEPPRRSYLDLSHPLKPQLINFFSQDICGPPPGLRAEIQKNLQLAGPVILEILKDTRLNHATRVGAIYALQRLDIPGSKDALFELARSTEGLSFRWSLVQAIGRRGDPGSAALLVEMIPEGDALVTRRHIIEALGYTGAPEARLGIAKAMENTQITWESFSKTIDRVNIQLDTAAAKNPVSATIPLLHSEDPEMREWALVFLKRLNPPNLNQTLREAVESIRQWTMGKRKVYVALEYDLLSSVKECGGVLTRAEEEFVEALGAQQAYQLP